MTILDLEPVQRLTRDITIAAIGLGDHEVRFLVNAYYIAQDDRKRSKNQVRALTENEEPNEVLKWLAEQSVLLENQIKRALDHYSSGNELGQWARGIIGIGPVIAAGLMAHIDIKQAPTVGHIWRFAGLDPTVSWEKKNKRPWNADLKTLCWKVGESFIKQQNHENDVYGKVYAARKLQEIAKNEAGDFAEQAAMKLEKTKIGKTTDAYKAYIIGKLPPAHIHSRARRYAVKLFLSHYHDKAYRLEFGEAPPLPYPIAHLGHAHMIEPPQ